MKRVKTLCVIGIILSSILVINSCTKEKRIPWVKTIKHTPANITNTTAILEGEVKATGWEDVTERGVALGLTKDFTTPDFTFKAGNGEGEFVATAIGLTPDQTYFYKAYAVNKIGTRYGKEYSFKTKAGGTPPPPPPPPPPTADTVVDVDGNKYKTVTIGGQIWMQQNLRVARYRNGDPIPNVTVNAQWATLTTGAFCWENNDPSRDIPYGKLYNFYAVEDPRGICPVGWRVGTDDDWKILETTAGMIASDLNVDGMRGVAENVGGKLKATTLWDSPNTGATDEFGFSGLPGGYRSSDGLIFTRQNAGTWWTGTDASPNPWLRGFLSNSGGSIRVNMLLKRAGKFVRCIKE